MQPNIVIINPDQMRWDYASCRGHPFIATRHLDRLAAMGTRFSHAFAASPMCGPSRTSFLTGKYPIEHGIRQYGGTYDQAQPNALRVLGDAGYVRGIWGKDHTFKGNVIGSLYDEGEDICLGIMGGHLDYINAWDSTSLDVGSKWNLTKRLTDEGLAFINRQARTSQPFFLTLNYQDPHPFFACPEQADDCDSKELGEFRVNATGQFETAAVALIMNFLNRPHYVAKQGRTPQKWRY